MNSSRERRDWGLLGVLLIVGVLFMLLAGSAAIRIIPRWQVAAGMGSHLDPDQQYRQANQPGPVEPINQQILTPPTWAGSILTPQAGSGSEPTLVEVVQGGDLVTVTPLPTRTPTPSATSTRTATLTATRTRTRTLPPPASRTPLPPPGSITVLQNSLPDSAQDFSFSSSFSVPFSLDDDGDPTLSNTISFSGLASGIYTVTQGAVSGWYASGLNCVDPDSGSTTDLGTLTATIDLDAGESVSCTFTIARRGAITILENSQPDSAQDFTYNSSFAAFTLDDDADPTLSNTVTYGSLLAGSYPLTQGAGGGWSLTGLACSDPDGGSSTNLGLYTATIDLDPGETVSCTFTNTYNFPEINLGAGDGNWVTIPDGYSWWTSLSTPITAHGDNGWDLVYYELAAGSGIYMDFVRIEVSQDNSSWTTIFYYGGNLFYNSSLNGCPVPESDNTDVPATCGFLIGTTGVGIDINQLGLTGPYGYLRISSVGGGAGDGCDVDAVEIYP